MEDRKEELTEMRLTEDGWVLLTPKQAEAFDEQARKTEKKQTEQEAGG